MMKTLLCFLVSLASGLYVAGGYAAEDLRVLTPNHEAKITVQVLDENKLLVSVLDAEENPIRGLGSGDFVVHRGTKKAKILSAESLETSKEVPLNIVFVVDNSSSMKRRKAVEPLLSALEEFFKTVRPIDNIQVVVFSTKEPTTVREHTLRAKTFSSNEVSELRDFFRQSFDKGLTSGTYLYEAMVAGIDLIRRMPENDQKFLVVFSDGEDINSKFTQKVVGSEALGIPNFEAYSVDYMPRSKMDPFLKLFAESHGGRIWKARSATELVPIFQSFTTTLLYRYVVSYRVLDPPRGELAFEPAELNFDVLTMIGGAPLMSTVFFETGRSDIPERYVLFTDSVQTGSFDEENLTTALDRYLNVLNLVGRRLTHNPTARIRIVGCNSDTGVEENNLDLSRRRAEAVRDYLSDIWSVENARMDMETRNLPATPTPMIVLGGRPENQRVEIVFDSMEMQDEAAQDFIVETNNTTEIKITPQIVAEYGVANWELTLLADNQTIKTLEGTDDLNPSYIIPLDEFDRQRLTSSGTLSSQIRVVDIYNDSHETSTSPCQIRLSTREVIHELVGPPGGSVAIEPGMLTIEELTTIDSSPLLNYVFFEAGESEVPDRYILFTNQADTRTFEERKLRTTMDKYYHILNIVGKRLVAHPKSRIKIVGCNSNRGVERGRRDLSRGRAEAVRAYLRYIWGIELWRMDVESRDLPAAAATSSVKEGRLENQRVEIYSDSPEILDTIKSTYVEAISDASQFRIVPKIEAGYDLAHWTIQLTGDDGTVIGTLDGERDLLSAYTFNLRELDLLRLASFKKITATVEAVDKKGQIHETGASSSIKFIKREEGLAEKTGYKVQEKYALILFDFDSAEVKDRNKAVLDQIIERIKEVPTATVAIVGHTDTIGKEAYNIALSQRRAKTAYDQILAGGIAASERMTYDGAGPHNPLYDNDLPEGRAFNRTVTVILEYEERD
jgi:outer membrane protein OmpA-like peptidoglycan-associated protein